MDRIKYIKIVKENSITLKITPYGHRDSEFSFDPGIIRMMHELLVRSPGMLAQALLPYNVELATADSVMPLQGFLVLTQIFSCSLSLLTPVIRLLQQNFKSRMR